MLLLYLTLLVFQCAVVPQWAWRSSHWTRRHWWWAGNAPWPSTTRPSPVTWSPTAGWKVMLLMKRRSPRLGTRERWVLPTASQNRPKPESFFFFCFHIFLFLFQHGCGLNSSDFFFQNLRCMWQDQRVAGSVTVCRGGDRLWWTLLVAVGWYEGPDTPLSLTCLRIDT